MVFPCASEERLFLRPGAVIALELRRTNEARRA